MTTYATEIRDAAVTFLTAAAETAGKPFKKVRSNWGWPLGAADLPALSVFVPREQMAAEGDGNAGEPSFVHDVTLGIVGSFGYATPEELDVTMTALTDVILPSLLTTSSFLALVESVERIDLRTVFDKDGETFIAEVQLDMTVRFRTDWPPVVPDAFLSVAVRPPTPAGRSTPPNELVLNVPQE